MPTITVIGSLNYDLVTYTDKVPEGGETFQANSFENHLGGKGLNEALASARLLKDTSVNKVRMVGNIGEDSFGKELKQALLDANVDTQFVQTLPNQSSGVAVILVEEQTGENRILITAGANGELKPTDSDYNKIFPKDQVSKGDFVILQNEYPDTVKSIEWIKANRPSINIAYNPSPFKPELITSDVLSKIDLLILNEGEALDVARQMGHSVDKDLDIVTQAKELAEQLSRSINKDNIQTIVITLGSKGSVFTSGGSTPSFTKSRTVDKVVDTTGAGDTFFGGVTVELSLGKTIDEAIEFATCASSITIRSKGAAESIPTFLQVSNELGI
ncbi:ribokinase [[Candida] anglica]|uniref:Ribokinase n=1 Tax=[Candida] anglica TaxID=148631 RepID=A0ABP0EMP2_9ASCO